MSEHDPDYYAGDEYGAGCVVVLAFAVIAAAMILLIWFFAPDLVRWPGPS